VSDYFSAQLMRGSLDLLVLSVLADGPKYGYLIQQRLREGTDERIKLQAGTLYPLLHRLQDEKLIKSHWETTTGRRRKWYELTPAGSKRLAQQARQWDAYAQCMRRFVQPILELKPA
jgi:DNA-binding PadR family transcriptional regulator